MTKNKILKIYDKNYKSIFGKDLEIKKNLKFL